MYFLSLFFQLLHGKPEQQGCAVVAPPGGGGQKQDYKARAATSFTTNIHNTLRVGRDIAQALE